LEAKQSEPETRIIDFFRSRGYNVTAPKSVRGISGYDEDFAISATKGRDEILIDVASGESPVGPEKVVAFFAKIFDARPKRPVLICVPSLDHDAKSLVTMYKIESITAPDMDGVLSRLSEIFRPQSDASPRPASDQPSAAPPASSHAGTADFTEEDRLLRETRARIAQLKKERE
jgi:hypothetical protein